MMQCSLVGRQLTAYLQLSVQRFALCSETARVKRAGRCAPSGFVVNFKFSHKLQSQYCFSWALPGLVSIKLKLGSQFEYFSVAKSIKVRRRPVVHEDDRLSKQDSNGRQTSEPNFAFS
jgi:hypothetical protein